MTVIFCLWPSLGKGQPTLSIILESPNPQALANFGRTIASGDINGDGYIDLVVGAPFTKVERAVNAGQVFIFLGPELTTVLTVSPPILQSQARFGRALATGDINGDGLADLIIGAPNATVGNQVVAGQVFVLLAPDFATIATLQAPSPQERAQFGWAVAAGDINGDGLFDVVVGATLADVGIHRDAGQAFVFLGPDLSTVFSLTAPPPAAGEQFGREVTTGDLDGDGRDDVIVGASFANDPVRGLKHSGRVVIFHGADFDMIGDLILEDPEPAPKAWFGRYLSAGDANGDGVKDLLVGAPRTTVDGQVFAGQAFVFWAPTLTTFLPLKDPHPEVQVAFSKGGLKVNDMNEDGFADVIVGAPWKDVQGINKAGQVFVFLGPDFTDVMPLQSPAPQRGGLFGLSLATGDINGDGKADTAVGAPQTDVGDLARAGQTFVFFTGEGSP